MKSGEATRRLVLVALAVLAAACGSSPSDVQSADGATVDTTTALGGTASPASEITEAPVSEPAAGTNADANIDAVAKAIDAIVNAAGAVPGGPNVDLSDCPWQTFPEGFESGITLAYVDLFDNGTTYVSCTVTPEGNSGSLVIIMEHMSPETKTARLEQLAEATQVPGPHDGVIYEESDERYFASTWMQSDVKVSFTTYAEARHSSSETTALLIAALPQGLADMIEFAQR